jgi:hypothetical protein
VAFAREAGRDPSTLTGTNQLAIYVGPSRAATEAPLRHWLQTEWDVAAWSESTLDHAIRGSVDDPLPLRARAGGGHRPRDPAAPALKSRARATAPEVMGGGPPRP